MFDWIKRFMRQMVDATFTGDISAVNTLKKIVEETKCPACEQSTLQLEKYANVLGIWEASVSCTNCEFVAVLTSEGFDIRQIHSAGKAVEKGKPRKERK